jgi:hypothetical protein
MLGLVLWFNVDGDHGVWHFRLQFALDAITDIVSFDYRNMSRHHKVEIDEGHLPRVARPHVARLEGADRFDGNDLANFLEVFDGDGFVHQPAE